MKKYLLMLAILCSVEGIGSKISSAFEALSIYDYFKAKNLFYASLPKEAAAAGYGLSVIYARTDNPFSNIDSAAKYIRLSAVHFKDTARFGSYVVMPSTIAAQSMAICAKGYAQHAAYGTICDLNDFLEQYYFASEGLLAEARLQRDRLALKHYRLAASSDSMQVFLRRYPESTLQDEATQDYLDFQYAEQTPDKSAESYKRFITAYPHNPHRVEAESKLFQLTAKLHNADSLYQFIRRYSSASRNDAWRMLYSLSVPTAARAELDRFLDRYPDYPFRADVENEIAWSQQMLLVLKDVNDRYGYADTSGNWIIRPVFDDAADFHEGFAGVCRNDSCYFINKSGQRTSLSAEETFDYNNGLAIIKKQGHYYLINRSGQIISRPYEDISPMSDGLFVAKQNGLYGALNEKAETAIPFVYKKLGTFRNGYAYYVSEYYGLVSTTNIKLEARWDWISETDTNGLVIVKKDKRFGLMNLREQLLLDPEFDYISHCTGSIYLLMRNNLYGFYDTAGRCYVTEVAFSYHTGFDNAYYTNGRQFKLVKDEQVALVDANGRISIPFGTYTDLFFAREDLIRIQKGKRYGYVDRKLKPVTPVDYDKATDFDGGAAIVAKAGTMQLINRSGKVLFTAKDGLISKAGTHCFKIVLNGLMGLITAEGEILLPAEYSELEMLNKDLWRAIKDDQLFLYHSGQRRLTTLND